MNGAGDGLLRLKKAALTTSRVGAQKRTSKPSIYAGFHDLWGIFGGVKSGTVAKPSLKPTLVGVSGLLALVMSLELFCHFTFPVDSLPTRRLPWPETTVCHH